MNDRIRAFNLIKYYKKKYNKPFIVSFSGPSSSGKSTLISLLKSDLTENGFEVKAFGSISRNYIKKESDRYSEELQLKMAELAYNRDLQAFSEKADIILLDRNLIDGYIVCKYYNETKKANFSSEFFKKLEKLINNTVFKKYNIIYLLKYQYFVNDGIRLTLDKEMKDYFINNFRKFFYNQKEKLKLSSKDWPILVESVPPKIKMLGPLLKKLENSKEKIKNNNIIEEYLEYFYSELLETIIYNKISYHNRTKKIKCL